MKRFVILSLFFVSFFVYGQGNAQQIVNVFGWHGDIPHNLIQAFEKETGIKVNFDVYDSNEVLEAKLLAGHTGYDVVFPTAWPYLARQAASHLYAKIDRSKLPHYKNIDPLFLERMEKADPGNLYALPYTWGLVAIGYNPKVVDAEVPKAHHDSWALLYNPEVLQSLQQSGVSLLEDPLDVFLTYYLYKGEDPLNSSVSKLKEMRDALKKIRPYIRRFGTSLVAEQLGNGELGVVMHWNGVLSMVRSKFQKLSSKTPLKIILPKEGTLMWVDCIAIPKDAPHMDNAHKFIDFLLRATSAAHITNTVYTATTIKKSHPLLSKAIQGNKTLFPGKAYMKKVILPEVTSLQFQRQMSRFFASIITHKE